VRRRASQQQAVVYRHETMSTTSGSESLRSRRSHLSRSKSLDQEGGTGRYRSRSLDPYQDSLFYKEIIFADFQMEFQNVFLWNFNLALIIKFLRHVLPISIHSQVLIRIFPLNLILLKRNYWVLAAQRAISFRAPIVLDL
jgi:hypothetical protein